MRGKISIFTQITKAMKQLFLIIFFSIAMLSSGKLYSQDTINMLDGHRIVADKIYTDSTNSMVEYDIQKKEKTKQKSIDRLEIYSISYHDKTQKIIYRKDTALGFPLSIQEMGNYVLGEREARKSYKAPLYTIGGLVLGGVAANYIQFWSLIVPVVYGTGSAIINPKVKTSKNISPELRSDKNFISGYKEVATKKKVKNALLGSAAGIAIIAIASQIINMPK